MKKCIAALLLLCLLLGLCACGENTSADTTPSETQTPTEGETGPSQEASEAEPNYFITVVDTDGEPVSGAIVQMCKLGDDGSCTPATVPTDAQGKVSFTLPEDSYKVSFIVLPGAYTYVDEAKDFYFAEGARELTITVKKA